ncbi:GNAT family N-acetyltransferase [Amycolatopsis alkalitolerans]|uniref:N-acetyltransferase n=1 Tax=Amycolatopsis alkalitolerans TaxID=2547244 RepID=A0A5C4M4K5_9PSEU|nr:GNAT family N-acetyltransferase [Amycolatopsis alkalitolerans]TNC26524.1 N-acetyltransferase [Amycolatopsis alkalitolerans]
MNEIRRNDEKSRYEISVDGQVAGYAQYADRGDQRVFYHTKIADEFGGRGLSAQLISEALAQVRASGKRVVAVCPFVAAYLRKHPDEADIADRVTPDVLGWLDKTLA